MYFVIIKTKLFDQYLLFASSTVFVLIKNIVCNNT